MSPLNTTVHAYCYWLRLGAAMLLFTGGLALHHLPSLQSLFALPSVLALIVLHRDVARIFARGLLHERVWRQLGLGLVLGTALGALTCVSYPWLAARITPLGPEVQRLYDLLEHMVSPSSYIGWLSLILVVGVEELLWRELLLVPLRERFAAHWALLLAALSYTLPQVALGSWLLAFVAFALGLVWGALRLGTGSLWVSLACHLGWNVFVFFLFPLA